MIEPMKYASAYCEITDVYERYGNYTVQPGEELFLYITDQAVPGIENKRYAISNKLRVYDYHAFNFVNITFSNYLTVSLYVDSKCKSITFPLHRLYMLVFCYFPGCENYEVNHIDGNKSNDNPTNLEWMTHKENMRHAFDYGLVKTKLTDEEIAEIIRLYNQNHTIKYIADRFQVSTGYISEIVLGPAKGHRTNTRIEELKVFTPVTREKFVPKLHGDILEEAARRYNNGEEYFELDKEYGMDRSSFTKQIKRYAKTHPEIILRPLKKFTPELAEQACQIFEQNKHITNISELYDLCLDIIGLENIESNRKALKNLYHRKTYKHISEKYNY